MPQDLISISSDVLPDDAHVLSVKGKEGLSEPYRFEIGLRIDDPSFDIDAAVRGRASVSFDLGNGQTYVFHGIFAAVEHLHSWLGKGLFRALLVPQLWNSTLTRHSRVFIEETIPDIIEAVLVASGMPADGYQLKLQGSYPTMEFVAQYKESNFQFISRWMEREGMYYYFEQGDDREKLIITDSKGFHQPQPGDAVRFVPLSGQDAMASEALSNFTCRSRALPASIELIDYDYVNPSLDVVGTAAVSPTGFGEISSFGANFFTQDEGNRLAQLRAEEYLARQKVFGGKGRVFNLRPGYIFTLDEHPNQSFNAGYLTTQLEHRANQSATEAIVREMLGIDFDDEYACTVTAIPSGVQYRSPDRFVWPRIEGYEAATVCGAADSQYAQIDDHGRYRVRIMFDESDLDDGAASTWVRMQQPHGGTNEGFHFPLRKGTEVLLFFQGGDPDRPVIAGVAPNAHTPSPVIEKNYTTNIIQTGGLNLFLIEDNSGQQYIYQYCPTQNTYLHMGFELHEWNIELNTEGHAHFHFGGDQVIDIDLTLTENVTLDVTNNYNANFYLNVIDNWQIEISGIKFEHVCLQVELNYDADYSLTILGLSIIDITGTWDVHVGGKVTNIFDCGQDITITGDQNLTIKGDQNVTITGKQKIDVQSDWKWDVHGHEIKIQHANSTEITYGLKNEAFFGTKNSLHVGGATDVFIGGKDEVFIGQKRSVAIAGEMALFLGMKMELALGLFMSLRAGAHIEIDGSLDLRNASISLDNLATKIETAGPNITLDAICLFL